MSDNLFIRTTTHSDTRAHIPSQEEAGYEKGNSKVKDKQQTDLPLNPVTTRGQDPELFWLNKYGKDGLQERLSIDIRSLYRHEHIVPENLIKGLFRTAAPASGQLSLNDLFGNALDREELNKTSEYYQHPPDGWTNRLIQGDSELVMASLLEREGMAGTVQCVYFDPPYGIKYGSNWQKDARAFDFNLSSTFKHKWNLTDDGGLWMMKPDSVTEIGCIHTSQGLELDYIGVIIGPDLLVRNGEVATNALARASADKTVQKKKELVKSAAGRAQLDLIIKNTYRTLMTRAMKGCYVYCTDPETAAYLRHRISNPA